MDFDMAVPYFISTESKYVPHEIFRVLLFQNTNNIDLISN